MPRIYLCFLWHMHQPFYKDLISGEYKLPWTRLHALKDYYGMVRILEEFPLVRQTFNLVPSMMVQVQEYAAGTAHDFFLELALKPAESLTGAERDFMLANFFHAEPSRMIYRYPRYGELYDARQAQKTSQRGKRPFSTQDLRDLQVLSQLAWFDEFFQTDDPEVAALISKGRDFSPEEQARMGSKQRAIAGQVIPAYKRLATSGQIEISTTPYYHPILPLICDSEIAGVSHPNVALPPRFSYPGDARVQLERARDYVGREFEVAPGGLWPSEGSVSDEALTIAAETGFRWAATDSGVLARTLGRPAGVDQIYRPYRWSRNGCEIHMLFRDHLLSDLIGFVYSRMDPREAAADFLNRIRENCRGILQSGRDALVPIMLDGENAWEYYEHNGRPFLRELYSRISRDGRMVATTIGDALERIEPDELDHIFPGSWINANFDVWIGADEDNQAWSYLLRAREAYDRAQGIPQKDLDLAYEELLIAEGSDWCWWYGPEHESVNRVEFDQLYRSHLANVYRALHQSPPEELSRPILRLTVREFHLGPSGSIHPAIDGEISSYFEWLGAGLYRIDERSGAMHGRKTLVHELHYGSDGSNIFIRLDFSTAAGLDMEGSEARINVQSGDPPLTGSAAIRIEGGKAHLAVSDGAAFECAFRKILEVRVSLAALGIASGAPIRFELSLWKDGLPLDAIPQHGWLELSTDPQSWERF